MSPLSNHDSLFLDDDDSEVDTPHPVTEALLAFDACRSQAAQAIGYLSRPRRIPEPVIVQREPIMENELHRVHDLLSEAEQLRAYRFYLTALHRESIMSRRFDAKVMPSPQRMALLETDYEAVSEELDEIIEEVASCSPLPDEKSKRLQAANMLWSMTWWIHVRQDATAFRFLPDDDVLTLCMLGRAPDAVHAIASQIYVHAAAAELAYHDSVRSSAA